MLLPDGYDLRLAPPAVEDYLRLRRETGLSPKTAEQAVGPLANSWRWCTVLHVPSGETAAMGRVIGDGGWYFHIADMATLPAHQRRGLGRVVLDALIAEIEAHAPPDPYVTLLADEPGRPLYAKAGFVETAPHSIGMMLQRTWPWARPGGPPS